MFTNYLFIKFHEENTVLQLQALKHFRAIQAHKGEDA